MVIRNYSQEQDAWFKLLSALKYLALLLYGVQSTKLQWTYTFTFHYLRCNIYMHIIYIYIYCIQCCTLIRSIWPSISIGASSLHLTAYWCIFITSYYHGVLVWSMRKRINGRVRMDNRVYIPRWWFLATEPYEFLSRARWRHFGPFGNEWVKRRLWFVSSFACLQQPQN